MISVTPLHLKKSSVFLCLRGNLQQRYIYMYFSRYVIQFLPVTRLQGLLLVQTEREKVYISTKMLFTVCGLNLLLKAELVLYVKLDM